MWNIYSTFAESKDDRRAGTVPGNTQKKKKMKTRETKEQLFIKAVTEGLQIMGYYDAEYIKTLYRSELVRHGYITPQEL